MNGGILEVKNLSKAITGSRRWFQESSRAQVVRGVSFVLARGRTFGLVGESGSGKTTIARLLVRLIEADSGEIRFDGVDVRALRGPALRQLRRRMQIVAQDPSSSFDPRVRIGAAIAQPIRLHRLRPEVSLQSRVVELLDQVGLPSDLTARFPHELSGGQLQRLAISRALAVEPELIVLDEVVSALDALVQAQVLNLLLDLQRRLGMTFVFISHDAAAVSLVANEIGVLFAGRIVERGSKEQVFNNPRHPYTRALLSATPGMRWRATKSPALAVAGSSGPADRGCRFAPRCPLALSACREGEPALVELGGEARVCACLSAQEQSGWVPPANFQQPLSSMRQRRIDLLSGAARTVAPDGAQGRANSETSL